MKYLSIQTFQCGISVSGAATFTGGATINLLALNGATTSSEASLFLGAHGVNEGGQLVLQKGTSQTYAAHLDNYSDQFRVLYGTNTSSAGVALAVSLSTRQLILPAYTSSSSFSGTAAGYLAFDASGNIITTATPTSGVTSIIAGTGVTVSSGTGNVTVSIGQSVATSATPSFDQIFLTNNGNGTNVKVGDDAWIGDANVSNTLRIMGQQNNADGYIIFGNGNTTALGRAGTGNLTYGGSTVWTAATLTNLSQLTNDPGYITSAALSGYVPTSRTITINGTTQDLSADRTWTINTVAYTSRLQHQVKAGVAINKGQAVYVTSADGTNMIVGLASNASETTSSKTMGLLDATVALNGFANVVTEGLLAGLDTSTAGAEGDPVWLGTGGNLIYGLANKPYAPAHLVFIGIVTRKNNSNGEIFVKVQNGFELEELHNVDLITSAPSTGQLLRRDSDGLWKNWTPNYLTAEADTLASVTGRGASTNTSITVNNVLNASVFYLPQNPVGVTYANVSTQPSYYIGQTNGDNDFWKIYGESPNGTNSGSLILQSEDDYDSNESIIMRFKRTYSGYATMDSLVAQYDRVYTNVNLGVGTSSPAYKLDVSGDIRTTNYFVGGSSGQGFSWGNFTYGSYIDVDNSQSALRIRNTSGTIMLEVNGYSNYFTGNVGIGTTSPANKLVVVSDATYNSENSYSIAAASATNTDYKTVVGYDYANDIGVISAVRTGIQWKNLSILPVGNTNLGIGTITPSQRLHVSGNIRVTGAYYDSNNSAGTSGQILKSTGTGTDWVSLSEITGVDGTGTANYVTKWSDSDTITNSLIYDNGTNVGIGTASPGYNFDVNGQVRVQDKLRVGNVNSGNGVVHASSSATINPSATTIVWSQNVSVGMCAFIEYYILNTNTVTDQRAGTIIVTWNQSGTPTITHTETTTPDIGSTATVNFISSLVGSDARISAVNSSAAPYTIVMNYRYF